MKIDIHTNYAEKTKLRKNLGFRSWFYFRMGWTSYFSFVFAAINTMTVTYYLAIENIPSLKDVFPSFSHYLVISFVIGIPLLVLTGWAHFRRTPAYGSEAEVQIESNPYFYKAAPGWQREAMFPTLLKLTDYMIKTSKNEKLSDEDIEEMKKIREKIDLLVKGEALGSPRNPHNPTP